MILTTTPQIEGHTILKYKGEADSSFLTLHCHFVFAFARDPFGVLHSSLFTVSSHL